MCARSSGRAVAFFSASGAAFSQEVGYGKINVQSSLLRHNWEAECCSSCEGRPRREWDSKVYLQGLQKSGNQPILSQPKAQYTFTIIHLDAVTSPK
jgi:hypothetical protein